MEATRAIDPRPPADPLGEALHFLRMNGAYYCRSELTAPWGLTLPPMPEYIWFHVSPRAGSGSRPRSRRAPWMQLGDLALVPHGEGHVLRSEPGATAPGILDLERELVSDRYEILRHGGAARRPASSAGPCASTIRPPATSSRSCRR